MKYLRMHWKQDDPIFPATVIVEIDDDGMERRKVEIFANGGTAYADADHGEGETRLSPEPWDDADIAGLASDPAFEVESISAEAFEKIWAKRTAP